MTEVLLEGLLRDVTEEEIRTYREEGAVKLPAILSPDWVKTIGEGIDEAIYGQWQDERVVKYDSSELADMVLAGGGSVLSDARAAAIQKRGHFLTMIGAWTVNDKIRDAALHSPLGYIAGRLFGAAKVNFYDDQTLIKEPGTREYTAFHTDEPYYHLHGDQVCGMWVSPDVVTADSGAMRYVRGSHRWGTFFRPNAFINQQTLGEMVDPALDDEAQVHLPDIEGNEGDYDIVTYPSNPGDVLVHHSNLIHGSKPNYLEGQTRRAVSFRYAGDDVTYRFHKSAPPQPHHRHTLKDGDILDCDQFPVVWRR